MIGKSRKEQASALTESPPLDGPEQPPSWVQVLVDASKEQQSADDKRRKTTMRLGRVNSLQEWIQPKTTAQMKKGAVALMTKLRKKMNFWKSPMRRRNCPGTRGGPEPVRMSPSIGTASVTRNVVAKVAAVCCPSFLAQRPTPRYKQSLWRVMTATTTSREFA